MLISFCYKIIVLISVFCLARFSMAQVPLIRSLLYIDTVFLDYKSDSVFYSELLESKCPTASTVSTDYVSFITICRSKNIFFMRNGSDSVQYLKLHNMPKRITKHRNYPYMIIDIPNSTNRLFFFNRYFVLADIDGYYLRSWKNLEFEKLMYHTHADELNTYRLEGDILFCAQRSRQDSIFWSKKRFKYIPSYTTLATLSISDLLSLRRLRLRNYKFITSTYRDESQVTTYFQVLCPDTIRKLVWFSSIDFNSLVKYSPQSNIVKQMKLPDPIPPGVSYLKRSMVANIYNYYWISLKRDITDTMYSLIIFPSKIVTVDSSDKLMYMYVIEYNHDSKDSTTLADLEKHVLMPGKPWGSFNPSSTVFLVFQMLTPGDEVSIDWQVMVPLEHLIQLYSATENSITGIARIFKDDHYAPALITWHLK
jgi:hypothetical protein